MDSIPFNPMDICLFLILFISLVVGLVRGFTKETLGLLSWVGSGVAAIYGYPYIKDIASGYIRNDMLATIASGTIIFFVFLILLSFITNFLSRFVKKSVLDGVDRAFGGFFGLIRGVLILAVLNIFVTTLLANYTNLPIFTKSVLLPSISQVSEFILEMTPKKYKSKVIELKNKAKKSVVDPLDEGEKSLVKKNTNTIDETAMKLAQLMPKYQKPKNEKKKDGYERKNLSAMERLLQTVDVDEKSMDNKDKEDSQKPYKYDKEKDSEPDINKSYADILNKTVKNSLN